MKKILFISHDASRSGAPVLLLNLIRILKEDGFYIKVILKSASGELVDQFEELANEIFIYYAQKKGFFNKIKRRLSNHRHESRLKDILKNTDILINNTITNGAVLEHLNRYYHGPVITYIHEMEMAAKYYTTPEQIEKVIKLTNHFLVPSEAVMGFLINYYNIPKAKITKLNSYISLNSQIVKQDINPTTSYLKKQEFIIGSMGTPDWRKSPEIFVLVAKCFFDKHPNANAQFIWKGFVENSVVKERLQYDIKKFNLQQKVILEDASFEIASFYNQIDLFLLTSREDPYPLVVLEAATFKKPILCFKDAGGTIEFIQDDAGGIVPYLAIEEMADMIAEYWDNPSILIRKGAIAFEKVKALHCDARLVVGQFKDVLNQRFETGSS